MTGRHPTKDPNDNGWDEYQKLVLFRLEESKTRLDGLSTKIDALTRCQQELRVAVTKLQVKSSIWGAVAGGITGIGAAVASIFIKDK